MFLRELLFGISTFIPFAEKIRRSTTGGTNDARYCYSVWLRHLKFYYKHYRRIPKSVAELGPGESLGIGLAALLTGVEKYTGLDIVDYHVNEKNYEILEELINLFRQKENIPDDREFPQLKPKLTSYEFPQEILKNSILKNSLSIRKIEKIKNNLNCNNVNSLINYHTPWYKNDIIEENSVDLLYSQAVLEHVDDLNLTYNSMKKWLKSNGVVSHQIDFRSHRITKKWNGHWQIPNFLWKLIRGRRKFLINRFPYSEHQSLLKKHKFKIIDYQKVFTTNNSISKQKLAKEFKSISDEDFKTSGIYLMASLND